MDGKFVQLAVFCSAFWLALLPATALAQELPPIPADLLNSTAVTCIKISRSGAVEQAFIVVSTGDKAKDVEVLDWVRHLHWPEATVENDKFRATWIPMPVAFGEVKPLPMPATCSPEPLPTRSS